MKDLNAALFGRLVKIAALDANIAQAVRPHAPRWLVTNDAEKAALKGLRIRAARAGWGPLPSCCLLAAPGTAYFVVVSPVEADLDSHGVIGSVLPDAGHRTFLWAQPGFPLSQDPQLPDTIIEFVLSREGAFEAAEIARFFASCRVFELDSNVVALDSGSLSRLLGAWAGAAEVPLALPLGRGVLGKFKACLDEAWCVPIADILLRSMTSSHWEHAFIEAYRCLECLFPAPQIKALAGELGVAGDAALLRATQRHLGWFPHEDEAVVKLMSEASDQVKGIQRAVWGAHLEAQPDGPTVDAVAKAFYQFRCGLVHYRDRPGSGAGISVAGRWRDALGSVLDLIRDLFPKLQL